MPSSVLDKHLSGLNFCDSFRTAGDGQWPQRFLLGLWFYYWIMIRLLQGQLMHDHVLNSEESISHRLLPSKVKSMRKFIICTYYHSVETFLIKTVYLLASVGALSNKWGRSFFWEQVQYISLKWKGRGKENNVTLVFVNYHMECGLNNRKTNIINTGTFHLNHIKSLNTDILKSITSSYIFYLVASIFKKTFWSVLSFLMLSLLVPIGQAGKRPTEVTFQMKWSYWPSTILLQDLKHIEDTKGREWEGVLICRHVKSKLIVFLLLMVPVIFLINNKLLWATAEKARASKMRYLHLSWDSE